MLTATTTLEPVHQKSFENNLAACATHNPIIAHMQQYLSMHLPGHIQEEIALDQEPFESTKRECTQYLYDLFNRILQEHYVNPQTIPDYIHSENGQHFWEYFCLVADDLQKKYTVTLDFSQLAILARNTITVIHDYYDFFMALNIEETQTFWQHFISENRTLSLEEFFNETNFNAIVERAYNHTSNVGNSPTDREHSKENCHRALNNYGITEAFFTALAPGASRTDPSRSSICGAAMFDHRQSTDRTTSAASSGSYSPRRNTSTDSNRATMISEHRTPELGLGLFRAELFSFLYGSEIRQTDAAEQLMRSSDPAVLIERCTARLTNQLHYPRPSRTVMHATTIMLAKIKSEVCKEFALFDYQYKQIGDQIAKWITMNETWLQHCNQDHIQILAEALSAEFILNYRDSHSLSSAIGAMKASFITKMLDLYPTMLVTLLENYKNHNMEKAGANRHGLVLPAYDELSVGTTDKLTREEKVTVLLHLIENVNNVIFSELYSLWRDRLAAPCKNKFTSTKAAPRKTIFPEIDAIMDLYRQYRPEEEVVAAQATAQAEAAATTERESKAIR